MAGEVIGHARFLEAQERRRTADRAAPALVAVGPGEPATIDRERADLPPPTMTETTRTALAAMAKPPRRGPVARWRVRRPPHDR